MLPSDVGEIPAAGGRFKLGTGAHWSVTEADPKTSATIFHHGGAWTLKRSEYIGKTSYAIYQLHDGTLTITGNEPGHPSAPVGFDAPGARKLVFKQE